MRKTFFCLFALVCFSRAWADTAPNPMYELDLVFDPTAEHCAVRSIIQLPPSAIGDGTVEFDIANSKRHMVHIDRITGTAGNELDYRVRNDSRSLVVDLEEDQAEIVVEYSFRINKTPYVEKIGYYTYSGSPLYPELLQTGGAPFMFSDFRVRLEYPSTFTVLTSGGPGGTKGDRDRIVVEYVVNHSKGFAIVAGEGFELTRREDGAIPVVVFHHPNYADRFSIVIDRTVEAASWYEKTYGFFPLEQVGIIQGSPTASGGYPLPNMFAIHLGNLNEDFITWITAHELGHYYWGYTVLGEASKMGWLMLSLGIWSDQLYLAERDKISVPEQWLEDGRWFRDYFAAIAGNDEQQIGLAKDEVRRLEFDYNSFVRHGKAAVAVYLQSLLVGPDRFLDLQRHLLKEFHHRSLRESDFVAALADFGSKDSGAFYEAWKKDHASIGLTVSSASPGPGSEEWTIDLKRTGPVPYPIEVEAASRDGQSVRHVVEAKATKDAFTVGFEPVDIRIDPEGRIPTASSSHPLMRLHYIVALEWAEQTDLFLALGRAYLDQFPDDEYLRYRMARRLCELARWEESVELWPDGRAIGGRSDLRAALCHVRALDRLGRTADARDQLERLQAASEEFGLLDSWQAVRDEVAR